MAAAPVLKEVVARARGARADPARANNLCMPLVDHATIEHEYHALRPALEEFCKGITSQLESLVATRKFVLGTPIEGRVKTWDSVREKLNRKHRQSISELTDLVAFRVTLLFKRDVKGMCDAVQSTFKVVEEEDKSGDLGDAKFGYQSNHFLATIPPGWRSMPSLQPASDRVFEVQVRTAAQHIWAAVSHKLQYKHEASVPSGLLRSMNRVAALLEVVDLEFERVLSEREAYEVPGPVDERLNVDSLSAVLAEVFPANNKMEVEPYDSLLFELIRENILTVRDLREFLAVELPGIFEAEAKAVKRAADPKDPVFRSSAERQKKGVYFGHVGLFRQSKFALGRNSYP